MNNYELKKMLAEAGKDLKKAQEKYAEIERRLKNTSSNSSSTSYVIIFKKDSYTKDIDKKIAWFKYPVGALVQLKKSTHKINVNDISKCIKNGDISEGDVIALPYEDEKLGIDTLLPFNVCKITEKNEALCHCRFALDTVKFSAKESNDYKNSAIRKWLGNLISRFDDAMQKHFMQADIPYIDAYDEQIKIVSDKFWLLDQIELFTFYKTMDERKRTYLVDNAAAYWWLRHPYTGSTYYEYCVTASGSSVYANSYNSSGCVPACLIG